MALLLAVVYLSVYNSLFIFLYTTAHANYTLVATVTVVCVSYVLRQKKQLRNEHMIRHSRTRWQHSQDEINAWFVPVGTVTLE